MVIFVITFHALILLKAAMFSRIFWVEKKETYREFWLLNLVEISYDFPYFYFHTVLLKITETRLIQSQFVNFEY